MSRKQVLMLVGMIGAVLVLAVALRRGPFSGPEPSKIGLREGAADSGPQVVSLPGRGSGTRVQGQGAKASGETSRPRQERPRPAGRSLSGRVMNLDGTPLPGAVVSANFDTSATTDADGHYVIENLPGQVWRVTAAHPDCVTSSVRQLEREQATLDFLLRTKVPVVLAGTIVHHATKQPLAEFEVAARETVRKTGAPGQFEITGIFSGDEVGFRIEGKEIVTRFIREEIPAETAGRIERTYEVGSGGVIKGRVVRSGEKTPVGEAEIALRSFSRRGSGRDGGTTVVTAADGTFQFSKVSPGQIALQVRPPAPLVEAMRFVGELNHDEVKDVGDIEVGEGGTIKGRLVKVPGEEPLSGETVNLGNAWGGGGGPGGGGWGGRGGDRGGDSGGRSNDDQSSRGQRVTTDAQGEFEFTKVPPGWYRVSVPQYQIRESVTMEGEATREITLRVGSGTLRGLVLKEATPVRAELGFSRQAGQRSSIQVNSDEQGAFEVRGLAPGLWKVDIEPRDGRDVEMEVEMPEAGIVEKNFILPSGDVVGRVVDAQGQPVAEATITQLSSAAEPVDPRSMFRGGGGGGWGGRGGRGGGGGGLQSEPDGSFRLRDRDPGPLSLMARKEGFGASQVAQVVIPESGETEPVVLTLGSVPTGTLVSTALNLDTGQPIEGAWCILTGEMGRFAHSQRRGADGVIRVPDIPIGTYQVQVSASGYTVSEQTVTIAAGATVEQTDVISPAGAARLSFVDTNGAGVANVRVRLEPLDAASIEIPREGVSDSSGLYSVRGVLPGSYRVTYTEEGGSPNTATINITAGGMTQESSLMQ